MVIYISKTNLRRGIKIRDVIALSKPYNFYLECFPPQGQTLGQIRSQLSRV